MRGTEAGLPLLLRNGCCRSRACGLGTPAHRRAHCVKLISGSQVWQWAGAGQLLGAASPPPSPAAGCSLSCPGNSLPTCILQDEIKPTVQLTTLLGWYQQKDGSWIVPADSNGSLVVSANRITSLLLQLMRWLFTLHGQQLGCTVCAWGIHAIWASLEGLLYPKAVAGSWQFLLLLGIVS